MYEFPQAYSLFDSGPSAGQGLLGVNKPCGCQQKCNGLSGLDLDFSNYWTLGAIGLLGYGLITSKWLPAIVGGLILGGQWAGQKVDEVF